MEHSETRAVFSTKEINQPYYGTMEWNLSNGTRVASLSAPDWTGYQKGLENLKPEPQIVVSPELITFTAVSDPGTSKDLINQRIGFVRSVSAGRPETVFVLGTPYFTAGSKPINGALVIRDGEIVRVAGKKCWVNEWERDTFEFLPHEPAPIIPGTDIGILICADFAYASAYTNRPEYDQASWDRWLESIGKTNLIGSDPEFIKPDAKHLLIISCWGTGSIFLGTRSPNQYYKQQLASTSYDILDNYKNIEDIVVTDRLPPGPPDRNTPTSPFNAMFSRN